MQYVDTIISATWVIPMEPLGSVLEDHSVVIHEGNIVAVMKTEKVTEQYQTPSHQHLAGHVLMPGLINAHTHAAMTLMRGLADDLPLMQWLNDHIWPAESKFVDRAFVEDGSRLAAAEMLKGGVTCFNDMYFFPDAAATVSAAAGIRACVGMIVLDFPTVWAQDASEYIHKGLQVHDEFRSNPLVHTAFAPHAPYTVSDEPLKRIATLSEELDVPVHMHVHETEHEVQESLNNLGMRPLARLRQLGLLSPRLMAVHMTQLTGEEIQMIAEANVSVVHCPESNMKLASGFCPAHALLEAGVNLALGTDGTASNNDLDMLGETRSAALLAKAVAGDARALPAHQALHSATLAGANALGIQYVTGSLQAGKAADMIALDLNHVETQPFYDPASQIVYGTGRQHVRQVWVRGKQVVKDGVLTTLDEQELIRVAGQWRDRIRSA